MVKLFNFVDKNLILSFSCWFSWVMLILSSLLTSGVESKVFGVGALMCLIILVAVNEIKKSIKENK